MTPMPSKRLYLRNLPKHVGEEDLLKYLSSYGKIVEVKFVHDYAFVQFDLQRDAQDVLETFRRQPFLGKDIIIEFAHPLRKDTPSFTSSNKTEGHTKYRSRLSPTGFRGRYPIVVTNIPPNVRWQELKDFGRTSGGLVAYCDLDKKRRGRGFIEYFSRDEAERAIKELNGKHLGGNRVKVSGRPEVLHLDRTRCRSRSPRERRYDALRHRSPSDRDRTSSAAIHVMDANDHYYRDSSLPPFYSGAPISCRPSPHSLSPLHFSGGRNTPVSYPHYPTSQYAGIYEERYDYSGHALPVDAWGPYGYDYSAHSVYNQNINHYDEQIGQVEPAVEFPDHPGHTFYEGQVHV